MTKIERLPLLFCHNLLKKSTSIITCSIGNLIIVAILTLYYIAASFHYPRHSFNTINQFLPTPTSCKTLQIYNILPPPTKFFVNFFRYRCIFLSHAMIFFGLKAQKQSARAERKRRPELMIQYNTLPFRA